MQYQIRESSSNDKDLIQEFNNELKSHGYNFKLTLESNNISNENNFIFKRQFILTESNNFIRAGYTLKYQWFKINNETIQIGYYYNPITAGLFNKKYNVCGILLLKDAHKKNSNLFSLGMGGYSEALPKLLKVMSWHLKKVPFFFKIINPYTFLQNINYLKKSIFKSFIINLFAKSGLGWIFIKLIFFIINLNSVRFKKKIITVNEVEIFNKEVNDVWENTKKNVYFSAVRNEEYLKTLYSDKKFIKLRFSSGGEIVGWSISLCNKLEKHKYFGHMKLGSIVDCLSVEGYESSIINKTSNILKKKGADLIVSNQSHLFWQNAFKRNSFMNGPSNFIFASSENLSKKFKNVENEEKYIHVTRGDGDGPINL